MDHASRNEQQTSPLAGCGQPIGAPEAERAPFAKRTSLAGFARRLRAAQLDPSEAAGPSGRRGHDDGPAGWQ